MVRYIIPFVYKSGNYYAFVGKHNGASHFEITQLVPENSERIDRQIPVQTIRAFVEPPFPSELNLQQTIVRSLASYLQRKGWPIDEGISRN